MPGKFSLSDGYASADACTYFSKLRGVRQRVRRGARRAGPDLRQQLRPVYWPDIGSKGFKTVQIEDNQLTDRAVDDIRSVLSDPEHRADIVEFNHDIGKQHFSYDVLGRQLGQLLAA